MRDFFLDTKRCLMTFSDRRFAQLMLKFCIDNKKHLEQWEDIHEPEYFTLKYQRKVAAFEKKEFKSGRAIDLWILERSGYELIGKITVFGIVGGNLSNCMVGYKIAEKYEGRGYMSEALGEVVRFLFEELNMHRIEINILPKNERSKRLAERLGFKAEVLSPSFMRVNGIWEDHIRYVKLNDDYKDIGDE